MNKVQCRVTSCQHYNNDFCDLEEIQVDGPSAKDKSQTCCLSFDEKKQGAQSSVQSTAPEKLETKIKCSAKDCEYNDNKSCHADCIDVASFGASVSTKSGTQCDSFALK